MFTLRLCSHFTGQLLRRHENHTEYRLLIIHENSDLGAISVKVMLHVVCYTAVFGVVTQRSSPLA